MHISCFFFSSRRRHTRWPRDWSSDVCSSDLIINRLNLLWGVHAYHYEKYVSTDETIEDVNRIAKKEGFVKKGDYVINLSAMPIVEKGMVNTLRITQIE